jgi:hypothetical protein
VLVVFPNESGDLSFVVIRHHRLPRGRTSQLTTRLTPDTGQEVVLVEHVAVWLMEGGLLPPGS